jgi:hypothetical protein
VHCCVAVGPDYCGSSPPVGMITRVLVVEGDASKRLPERVLLKPVDFEVSATGVVLCVP